MSFEPETTSVNPQLLLVEIQVMGIKLPRTNVCDNQIARQ